MRNEHKVVVVKDPTIVDDNPYRAIPGQLVACSGDTIIFRANRSLQDPVKIQLPDIFDPRLRSSITLVPGQSESRQIRSNAAEGVYHYQVECEPAVYAKGASEPEIIIDN